MNNHITNWPDSVDEALRGTKYEAVLIGFADASDEENHRSEMAYEALEIDARPNAAEAAISRQVIRELVTALDTAQERLNKYIGCRCDTEDCEPGCCSSCQVMDTLEEIQTALATAKAWLGKLEGEKGNE